MKYLVVLGILFCLGALLTEKTMLIIITIIIFSIPIIKCIYWTANEDNKKQQRWNEYINKNNTHEISSEGNIYKKTSSNEKLKYILVTEGIIPAVKYYKDKHPKKSLLESKMYIENFAKENNIPIK